jgi:hypothetical protein
MEKLSEAVLAAIAMCILLMFVSTIGGTIMWLIYEDSIQRMFPELTNKGYLATTLSWWTCVKIVWLFGLLVKSITTVKKD